MRAVAYVLGVVGAAIVVGCSIGGTNSLFTSGGAGGGVAGAGPGTGGSAVTGNPTVGGGQGQGGSPSSSSHSSSAMSSSQMSSSSMSSSAMSSSSTGGPGDSVGCGDGLTCPRNGAHACCWNQDTQDDPPPYGMCVQGQPNSDGCNTLGGDGGFHAQIDCDAPEQCPGQFCCGHRIVLANNEFYDAVNCQPTCDGNNVRICDPNDNQTTCTDGTSCQQSGLLPNGYFVCN